MNKEIEYAAREAYEMSLSTEQSIKFIMHNAPCSRENAKQALQNYTNRVMMAH